MPAGTLAGRNFGWKIMEGLHCRSGGCDRDGLTLPVVEYTHTTGCSITGGYVYRGKALPALDGAYFYAERLLHGDPAQLPLARRARRRRVGLEPALDPETQLAKISTFGEDADGELYLVSLDGAIWALVPR